MKKQILFSALAVLFSCAAFSQTVLWSEDFGTPPAGTLANGYNNGNGAWTVNNTGVNGADPNLWYVSGEECGNAAAACGSVCTGGDASLHLGAPALIGDAGAAFAAGGLGVIFPETNSRVESPVIDLTGQTGMTLEFNYLEGTVGDPLADPADDDATLWYFDGAIWAQIDPLNITAAGCFPQGTWTAFTIAMPASANNNANVQIGFQWTNDDDNVGADPSFAVDDIQITIPAAGVINADFSTPITTICAGTCIAFTDATTGQGANPTWNWSFPGAFPLTDNVQNPTNICYNTAGVYDVILTSGDDTNPDDIETKVGYITVVAAPAAGVDQATNLCNNNTLDLNTLIPGATAGAWVETSGTPSGQFNAGTGVIDGNGLPVGNVYTFVYTATGTAPCADAISTQTITIIDCTAGAPPTADFTTPLTQICRGDCIDFTDASVVGTNPVWAWTFTGAATVNSSAQNPTGICYNVAGIYDVSLSVTDDNGNDVETKVGYIEVLDAPIVTATAAPNDTLCLGDMLTLTGGGATNYVWDNGVTDGVAFAPPIGNTTYTVTGDDGNACTAQATVDIVVENCAPLVAGFSYPDNICTGQCITLTDTSSGNITDWAWDFGGGATPNTSTEQSPEVCFLTDGVYDIQLTLTDLAGDNASVTNQITVVTGPSITALADTIIELGGQADLIALSPTPGDYLWTPDVNVDCDTCSTTWADPWQDQDYIVTISDVNGCTAEDTVSVYVNFIVAIDVPTAFSPNGDGNNDVLYVKGFGINGLTFSIYNRYGEKVFETLDQKIGWDGTFLGKNENSGVFTWILEYNLVNGGSGRRSGNTTLVR